MFGQRKFMHAKSDIKHHLEQVGLNFIEGFQAAIEENNQLDKLLVHLEKIKPEFRGFAYEGAAMGLALLDRITPWNRQRLQHFLDSEAGAHTYMIHVGAGWAWARLPSNFELGLKSFDPLLGWLLIDGYGFHQGYFYWPKFVTKQVIPRDLSADACKVFDQGLGRSLWFVAGAEPSRIAATIQAYAAPRQADLWSGIGLASAYAGGVDRAALEELRVLAHAYLPQVAQGTAFAAKARQRAGNPSASTELACNVFCKLTLDQAAQVTDSALENLPMDDREPAYAIWRKRIQAYFASTMTSIKEPRLTNVGGIDR